jgi:hypothetical protein
LSPQTAAALAQTTEGNMATEASDTGFVSPFHSTEIGLPGIAGRSFKFIWQCIMYFSYALLFLFTLVTVGFIEIRQANMGAFNTLIATLEQRDALRATDFDTLLGGIAEDQQKYRALLTAFVCPSIAQSAQIGSDHPNLPAQGDASDPDLVKTCNKIRSDIQNHSYTLKAVKDKILTKKALLRNFIGITKMVLLNNRRNLFQP